MGRITRSLNNYMLALHLFSAKNFYAPLSGAITSPNPHIKPILFSQVQGCLIRTVLNAMWERVIGVTVYKNGPVFVKKNANFRTHGVMFCAFLFGFCSNIETYKAILISYNNLLIGYSWYNTGYLT